VTLSTSSYCWVACQTPTNRAGGIGQIPAKTKSTATSVRRRLDFVCADLIGFNNVLAGIVQTAVDVCKATHQEGVGWDSNTPCQCSLLAMLPHRSRGLRGAELKEGTPALNSHVLTFKSHSGYGQVCLGRGALLAYLCSLRSQSIQSLAGTCSCGQPCC
jgi:hypothetical protein